MIHNRDEFEALMKLNADRIAGIQRTSDDDPPPMTRPTYRPVLSKNIVGVILSLAVFFGTVAAIMSVVVLVDASLDRHLIDELSKDAVHDIQTVDCSVPQDGWRSLACQLRAGQTP